MEVSVLYDELVRIFDPRRGSTAYANPEDFSPLPDPNEICSMGRTTNVNSSGVDAGAPPLMSDGIPDDWLDVVDTHGVDADGYVLLTPPLAVEKEKEALPGPGPQQGRAGGGGHRHYDVTPPTSSPIEADDLPHEGQWVCPTCTFFNDAGDCPVTCVMCEESFPFPLDPIPSPRPPACSPVQRILRAKVPCVSTHVPPPPSRPCAPSAVSLPPRYR